MLKRRGDAVCPGELGGAEVGGADRVEASCPGCAERSGCAITKSVAGPVAIRAIGLTVGFPSSMVRLNLALQSTIDRLTSIITETMRKNLRPNFA
jgi:hypothetical protein